MDAHLHRVADALSNFLEEDLSTAHLGLTAGARAHLERFRSFLHGFYVEKFGYWPPPKGSVFSKSLYRSVYFDFRHLYDFLVDLDSTESLSQQKPASGGVCVLQNVQAFDQRHGLASLPHPNPLLPDFNGPPKAPSQRQLLNFRLGSRGAKADPYRDLKETLVKSTNSLEPAVSNAPLVKAYRRFERDCLPRRDEKVSVCDARKVRWILIYTTLQMLLSVVRAPDEVRDVDGPTYPMCCQVHDLPPWPKEQVAVEEPATQIEPDAPTEFLSLEPDEAPVHDVRPTIRPLSMVNIIRSHNEKSPTSPVSPDISPLDTSNKRAKSAVFSQPSWLDDPSFHEPSAVHDQINSDVDRDSGRHRSLTYSTSPAPGQSRVANMLRSKSLRVTRTLSMPASATRKKAGALVRRSSIVVPVPPHRSSEIMVMGYGNGLDVAVVSNVATDKGGTSAPAPSPAAEGDPVQTSFDFGVPATESLVEAAAAGEENFNYCSPPAVHGLEIEMPQRTPVLDTFDLERICSPVGHDAADAETPSDRSGSAPLTPVFSSRSTSPSSTSSHEQLSCGQPSLRENSHYSSEQERPRTAIDIEDRQSTPFQAYSLPAPAAPESTLGKRLSKRLKAKRRMTLSGWESSVSRETRKSLSIPPMSISHSYKPAEDLPLLAASLPLAQPIRRSISLDEFPNSNRTIDIISALTSLPRKAPTGPRKPRAFASEAAAPPPLLSKLSVTNLKEKAKDKRRRSLRFGPFRT